MFNSIFSKFFVQPVQSAVYVDPSKIDPDTQCPVCLETPADDDSKKSWMVHSPGGEKHPIHVQCLNETFDSGSDLCPNCRTNISGLQSTAKRIAKHVVKNRTNYFLGLLSAGLTAWGFHSNNMGYMVGRMTWSALNSFFSMVPQGVIGCALASEIGHRWFATTFPRFEGENSMILAILGDIGQIYLTAFPEANWMYTSVGIAFITKLILLGSDSSSDQIRLLNNNIRNISAPIAFLQKAQVILISSFFAFGFFSSSDTFATQFFNSPGMPSLVACVRDVAHLAKTINKFL